jgi:hypothetical protein
MARGNPGINQALRALKMRKRPPTDDDTPLPSVFPGKKVKLIPGQLDLDGVEHRTVPNAEPQNGEQS